MTGWQTASLGEISTLISRGVAPKYVEDGGIAVLNQKCVRDHTVNTQFARRHDEIAKPVKTDRLVQRGDVLVNSTGTGTLGRVGIVSDAFDEPTTVDTHVTIVRPKPDTFVPKFFGYMMVSIEDQLKAAGVGTSGQTELSRTSIENEFRVSFPTNLAEQQRIVGILDQAFEGIANAKANAERNLANAKELLANAFDDLLALRCQDAPIAPLDTIAEFKNGLNFTRSSKGEVIKIVGVADFKNNFWTPEQLDEVQIEGSLSEAYELRDNDILVVRSNGNKELIGRCILARGVKGKTSHSGFTIRVRLHSDEVDAEYLTHFMKSSAVRKSLVASGDGANISSLNQKALSSIIVPLPPVSVQRDIVNDLSTLGEKIGQMTAIISQKSSAIDELRQSILHQAFSGNL